MEIKLDPCDEDIIVAKLKTGRYANPGQVVHAALGLMSITPMSIDELRAMVNAGIASLDRGEGSHWNAEQFIAQMHKQHPELA